MKDILHKEVIKENQLKLKLIAIISFALVLVFFIKKYFDYRNGTLFTDSSDKKGFIISTIILTFFIFLRKVTITIDKEKIVLKNFGIPPLVLEKSMIKSYFKTNKKDYYKYFNKWKHKRKPYKERFVISIPNYVILLNTGVKIFVQTKRKESFEYSMNKMLNLKYG